MKCEKSFKRNMLIAWGVKAIHKGVTSEEVHKTFKKMMRKTVPEIKEFVREA